MKARSAAIAVADLRALDDVAGQVGVLDEVVDERGRSVHGPVSPSTAIASSGSSAAVQHAGAQRVVDVVVDVGDAVDDPHDPPLERRRHRRAAGVAEDAVADGLVEVQPRVELEHVDDAQRVLVVAKAGAEALAQAVVEHVLADVAEGRVAEVVAEADRLGEVLVEAAAPARRCARSA